MPIFLVIETYLDGTIKKLEPEGFKKRSEAIKRIHELRKQFMYGNYAIREIYIK